jgi:cytochrome c
VRKPNADGLFPNEPTRAPLRARGRGGAAPATPTRRRLIATTLLAVLVTVLATVTAMASAPSTAAAAPRPAQPGVQHDEFSVLVFSKTAGFRHDSIPAGIAAIRQLGLDNHFAVTATEDAAAFTDANLAGYAAVIWLSTTGDVLNAEQQAAFERYIQAGGGYVGIHAASDTEYDWPWYGDLVGAYFDSHPHIQQADVLVPDRVHPSTADLPLTWTRTDEWYNFRDNPRGDVHVLAALDESSYAAGSGAMGHDHPISWCQRIDGGRAWYTGIGHTTETYAEPAALQHILGGILTAAGRVPADCGATVDGSFDQVVLAQGEEKTGEPIALAVLPDRRVVHTSRDGRVWLTTPEATTSLAATIPVYNHDEDGLQGVAIDPNFQTNRWVYLYYAPPLNTPPGDAPTDGDPAAFEPFRGHNQLSRFRLLENGTLDLASEQRILQVAADRGICCHAGGEIDFDAQGNLYLSTGDDTNPFASQGYTPIDERPTRNPAFDAQRSSANTNDLRGKVLRITVAEDGSYTVPAGNLFAPGTAGTRPEIYAMGFRNPFRFSVDRATGVIYLADYGPDAGSADPARGPGGTVEFNRITGPGNFGWPYCVGNQLAYVDFQFPSGPSGAPFDCAAPVNESPHNTGLRELPPAQPAWIPYDGASRPEFGNGSESPMGGPVYRFDPDLASQTKFPAYYDGKAFIYEWDRSWIKTVTMDADGAPVKIDPFFDSMTLTRPMNIEFGPEGSLYVLDYGSGYFGGSPESAVFRIDYSQGTRAPRVRLAAEPTSGQAPLTVSFDPAGTEDPDGDALRYEWDFTSDGVVDSTTAGPVSHTYTANGVYTARLTVIDATDRQASATVNITVGNTAPTVVLTTPPDGGVFGFGDRVPFNVEVTDPEDGTGVDCSRVVVEYILGHDDHGHPLSRATGCSGVLQTVADDGHGADANVFGVINATYTDGGANGLPPLTGSDEAILQPRTKQAEHFTEASGITVVSQAQAGGGRRVGYIDNGDWIKIDPVNLAGVTAIGYRVSSGGAGGTIEVRSGSVDGPLVQTVPVANTGGWDNYVELSPSAITDPGGSHPLYLVFRGTGSGGLFDVDVIRFAGGVGQPVCSPTEPEPGYTSLFDGTQASLAAWRQAGPGSFQLQDDCTLRTEGGLGMLWHTTEFAAYSLKVDWKLAGDDNSGVFVGFPDPGTDPWVAVNEGYEIQIDATDDADSTTGAIYNFQAPDAAARDAALNPPGEWNTFEIVVRGQTITVLLNGVQVNQFTSTDPARDLTQGHIGLQNHGAGDEVWFRNVRIAELDATAPTVEVSGIGDGRVYGDATDVVVSWTAQDSGSGLASVTATLDGAAVGSGQLIALHQLPLGLHTLRVTARDVAGNVTDHTVRFGTTTSLRDIAQLLDRFRATNRLSLAAYNDLSRTLSKARAAEASGNDTRAVRLLREFRAAAGDPAKVGDAQVRAVLVRDTDAVIAMIEGEQGTALLVRAVR